ncbi:MAG: histidine kinase [Acidobacteriota bacterium]|nr:histidine kinase [Acidobacteriota bacterium]
MDERRPLDRLWANRSALRLTAMRLGGLGAVVWAVTNQPAKGVAGGALAVPLLLASAVSGWLGWMAARRFGASFRWSWAALLVLAAAGGALVGYAPVAAAFVAVAALGAGIAFELDAALSVAAVGALGAVVSVLALSAPWAGEVVAESALGAVAGLMAGMSRRQYLSRAHEAEQLLAERVRADAERDRAAALAERNRLGRELHDVLAHSLGALAVQLEAAGAVLDHDGDTGRAGGLVHEARRLAVQGLEETRRAVHALRDEPVELGEQLASLAAREGAPLEVRGSSRALPPDAGMALYRAVQEALTNARKHAPGAPVRITLAFGPASTSVVVTNGASPLGVSSELGATGGGFGLQGMRERLEHVGGRVEAGAGPAGFRVEAAVPA